MMEWVEKDGVWKVSGWPYAAYPCVMLLSDGGWRWEAVENGCLIETGTCPSFAAAKVNAFDSAVKSIQPRVSALHEFRAEMSMEIIAQVNDAMGLALRVSWMKVDSGDYTHHSAVILGHKCLITEYADGQCKWEMEPEYYGHPLTWDVKNLELAKIQLASAALQNPCSRWSVFVPGYGHHEVEATSSDGAEYKALAKLGMAIDWRVVDGVVVNPIK